MRAQTQLRLMAGLVIGNLIWSAHPAMGKLVLADFSPAQGAWLRYAGALLAYLLVVLLLKRGRYPGLKPFFIPTHWRDGALVFALGFMTFGFSPTLQMGGLQLSQATDNALIVAMEPLMTVLLAWLCLGERLSAVHWVTFSLAVAGFALLADLSPQTLRAGLSSHSLGNLLMLLSLTGEAFYSVLSRKLMERHKPNEVFGSALVVGVLVLTVAAWGMGSSPPDLHRLTGSSALALFWLGPLGTSAVYLFWMLALSKAPVASIALTLFVQPVFGAIWGYAFLHERLGPGQFVGGALILIAVFAQAAFQMRLNRR